MLARSILGCLLAALASGRAVAQSAPDDPLASAEAIVRSAGADPLDEAEAVVRAVGPVPSLGRPAELLATHEILMEPTAWYYHRCRTGLFGSYDFTLYVFYPDGTYAYFNTGFHADGTVDEKYADVDYFLSEYIDGGSISGFGTWTLSDGGKVETKLESIPAYEKERRGFDPREFADGWGRKIQAFYSPRRLQLKRDSSSEYDYKRLDHVPRVFGQTASDHPGSRHMVPLR